MRSEIGGFQWMFLFFNLEEAIYFPIKYGSFLINLPLNQSIDGFHRALGPQCGKEEFSRLQGSPSQIEAGSPVSQDVPSSSWVFELRVVVLVVVVVVVVVFVRWWWWWWWWWWWRWYNILGLFEVICEFPSGKSTTWNNAWVVFSSFFFSGGFLHQIQDMIHYMMQNMMHLFCFMNFIGNPDLMMNNKHNIFYSDETWLYD